MKQVDNHREEHEKVIEELDGDGGWVDTHHFAGKQNCEVAGLGILGSPIADSYYIIEN